MRTVLVTDDNESVRVTLAVMLRHEGYQVLTAENAEKGLALARTEEIDAAVLDVHMPGMDGVTMCRALIQIAQEKGRSLPVWMMTGAYCEEITAHAVKAGALGVLRKPFDLRKLWQ